MVLEQCFLRFVWNDTACSVYHIYKTMDFSQTKTNNTFSFRYDEAVNALQKEINYNQEAEVWPITHRLVTCMVLLHLYRGDCVAADKAFKHGYA